MPLIQYPQAAYDRAVELARRLAEAKPHMVDYWEAEICGFFTGLRCCLPSAAVGIIVMVHDDALECFRTGGVREDPDPPPAPGESRSGST
jgi:hypothetical protein